MSLNSVISAQAAIDSALTEAFGNKNRSIDEKIELAGNKLPAGVSDDVAYLHETRNRIAHPRRRGQLDRVRVEGIKNTTVKVLGKVDVAKDKARARLNWLGGLVFNLIVFGVAYYYLLVWLGAI